MLGSADLDDPHEYARAVVATNRMEELTCHSEPGATSRAKLRPYGVGANSELQFVHTCFQLFVAVVRGTVGGDANRLRDAEDKRGVRLIALTHALVVWWTSVCSPNQGSLERHSRRTVVKT